MERYKPIYENRVEGKVPEHHVDKGVIVPGSKTKFHIPGYFHNAGPGKLTEIDKHQEYLQNAQTFMDVLEKDDELQMESSKLYRAFEKVKDYMQEKYKDRGDRANFLQALREMALQKVTADKPQLNDVYFMIVNILAYKLQ